MANNNSLSVDLQNLRLEVDLCDQQLMEILRRRLQLVDEIQLLKEKIGANSYDPVRESHIRQVYLQGLESLATPTKIEVFVRALLQLYF